EQFIDKIIFIFEWTDDFNPFRNSNSWKTILKIYYQKYINGSTIKEMSKSFYKYSKKYKQYYVTNNGFLTTSKLKSNGEKNKEATMSDFIQNCIHTINSWIEHKLSSFVYFIVFTLIDNGVDVNIEKDIENIENECERELLSYGLERHLIKKIVKKYSLKNINELKEIISNDDGYLKMIFNYLGIL
ncbi:MAG: hypothetical protein K2I76_04185, partial [Malacoplasma sp.]|nr:hypothetical protein [Malacoplasma sp.]